MLILITKNLYKTHHVWCFKKAMFNQKTHRVGHLKKAICTAMLTQDH